MAMDPSNRNSRILFYYGDSSLSVCTEGLEFLSLFGCWRDSNLYDLAVSAIARLGRRK